MAERKALWAHSVALWLVSPQSQLCRSLPTAARRELGVDINVGAGRYRVVKKRAKTASKASSGQGQGGGRGRGRGHAEERVSGCFEDMQTMMLEEFSDARGRVQCGIIYCLSRNDCEKVAEQLSRMRQKNGQLLRAHHYHANMDQARHTPNASPSAPRCTRRRIWTSMTHACICMGACRCVWICICMCTCICMCICTCMCM